MGKEKQPTKASSPKPAERVQAKAHLPVQNKVANQKKEESLDQVAQVEAGERVSILKPGILVKIAILALINVVAVAGTLYIVNILQDKAEEVKTLRSIQLSGSKGKEAFSYIRDELESAEAKRNELAPFFPDSEGLVTFVGEIDKLKGEGVVTGFSFVNEEPVKDKTGAYGLPILINLRGSWTQINEALGKILSLPYALRTIRIEATPSLDDPSLVDFRFGGFLYVDKSFNKD